ncbi:MAG: iron-containing alcohol dehydrogenase [Planctomycetes bacterium]|nr:iron-containing alcohol dehydrogenase [Planctomycetota bacterium]
MASCPCHTPPAGRPRSKETVNATSPEIFDFQPRTRIVFGPGSLARLGGLVREQGGRRTLLVTDPGIVRAGHAGRARESLEAAGIEVFAFDGVVENPTTSIVDQCVLAARECEIDSIVGLGGGSSMDTAKGCNFVLTGGGRMEDYWGVGKAARPMLPLIAVPTTAGTGSECQSFALISQEETRVKMACGDPKAAARVAILDPVLTLTQPPAVAASTGIDALSHAIESAVTRKRTPLSQMFSREAFRLCVQGLDGIFLDPRDLQARGRALLGAALAGTAIENSMLGAAHAAANPLTAHHGSVHGQAVGVMLPVVIRFNGEDGDARAIYRDLALAAGLAAGAEKPAVAVEAIASYVETHLERTGLPLSLAAMGVRDPDLEQLAEEAASQWTAGFNPREVSARDFAGMYRAALGERS